jgi:hypothetical protein
MGRASSAIYVEMIIPDLLLGPFGILWAHSLKPRVRWTLVALHHLAADA